MSKQLLIVYHSLTGGSKAMAQAVAEGAQDEQGVNVRLLHASKAEAHDVVSSDGLVFVCPETLGNMAGLMKDFFDRTYYAGLEKLNGKPFAVLVCAGSDGQGAAQQIERIAKGWRLKLTSEPLIVCTRAQTAERIWAPKILSESDLQRCRERGAAMGAGLVMGLF